MNTPLDRGSRWANNNTVTCGIASHDLASGASYRWTHSTSTSCSGKAEALFNNLYSSSGYDECRHPPPKVKLGRMTTGSQLSNNTAGIFHGVTMSAEQPPRPMWTASLKGSGHRVREMGSGCSDDLNVIACQNLTSR